MFPSPKGFRGRSDSEAEGVLDANRDLFDFKDRLELRGWILVTSSSEISSQKAGGSPFALRHRNDESGEGEEPTVPWR